MADREVASLVAAAQRGDDAAWRELVARYLDLVWSIARGHSLDYCDAADVTQTTWLRLYEQLPRLTQPSRVGAWLATTARRESLRVVREHKRQFPAVVEQLAVEHATSPAVVPGPEELLSEIAFSRGEDQLLWRAFDCLTPPCRVLLRALTADPPPSYSDLSEALGMPMGSIGPTRARCLDRLRANLLALAGPARPQGADRTVKSVPGDDEPVEGGQPEREVS
ncbi:MAG: RNA polymerase sigma factor [Acidimicrobiales bacterium]